MTDAELNLDAAVLMFEAVVEDLVEMVRDYPDDLGTVRPILDRLRASAVTATALYLTANVMANKETI